MLRKVGAFAALAVSLVLFAPAAKAQNAVWEEYDKLIQSRGAVGAMGPDLFGDQVSYYTGTLSFSATDVSLPGNNALLVALGRTLTVGNRKAYPANDAPFADWDLDLPNISGVFAASGWKSGTYDLPDNRCSAHPTPPTVTIGSNSFFAKEYWHGHHVSLPGRGQEELLVRDGTAGAAPATGGPYRWVTSGWTYVSCLPSIKNGTGEGFLAITADGTKYWFDWMAAFGEPSLRKPRMTGLGSDILTRKRFALYATRVEDRFGNWVTYSYSNANYSPVRLSRIDASDGRQITVDSYTVEGFIAAVSANGRTWRYQYDTSDTKRPTLRTVILPDSSRWTINFPFSDTILSYYTGEPGEQWRDCVNPGDVREIAYTGTITHPSGATGEFTVFPTRFYRSGVPTTCYTGPSSPATTNDDVAEYPSQWDAFALTNKRVFGPGLTTAEWKYSYFAGEVEVSGPESSYTRYKFGIGYRVNEGKLFKVEQGIGPADIRRTESYAYDLGTTRKVGTSPQPRVDSYPSEYLLPQKSRVIAQDGVTFSSAVASTCNGNNTLCYDAFARPLSATKSSSLGYSRTETTEYFDDLSRWVLGPVSRATTAGIETARTEFDSNSLPWRSYAFGKLQQTLTYNADGTVETVKDGRDNTVTLSSWKRGIPQLIQYPATPESPSGSSESAIVNDNGWITEVTDENGYATGYSYDSMGRLASVVYPTGEGWADTTRSFQQVWSSEYGIPAGHWKQTTTTGNGVKVSYFDALWQPLVEEAYDGGDTANTRSVTVKRYDADGRPVFQSYPERTLSDYAAVSQGSRTFYDPLGRVTLAEQDSELGVLSTVTEYLNGMQTRVTNPRQQVTTTSYMGYDQPTLDLPVAISHPEGAYTDIYRDVFGKTTALRRRNGDASQQVWRRYVYDGHQQLCKTIEPETGATVMDYDAAGNPAWSAAGLSLPDTANCNRTEAYSSGSRVDRSYDARNRVIGLAFPDGRGNQAWTYEKDGAVASITTSNSSGGDQVINRYSYNKRRLLTGEVIEQPGWYNWSFAYSYNANGHLSGQRYPSQLYVDYAPNALGQPTQAGSFATGVSYYPNGGIRQFTYGNGLVHSMTQNARQLPARSTDSGGALDHEYTYDANGNVGGIADLAQGAGFDRVMAYDGLDRLMAASSPMFGGDGVHRFTYDTLDNLKSWTLAGVKDHHYYYDPARNQLNNVNTSAGATTVALEYDLQGNLRSRNSQAYLFDYGNRLRDVPNKEWYRYDGHGRRVQSHAASGTDDLFGYGQNGQLLQDWSNRKNTRSSYVYLGGSLIAEHEATLGTWTTKTRYQHTDALGSPVAVSNEAGQVVDRTAYEPFGAAIGKTVSGPGYTGHVMDAATGLTYMQQRYYDPTIGRFLSVDPVTALSNPVGAFNRYWYANNNPYRFKDPDGRKCSTVDGKDSCTFDEFKDKKGNAIAREQAMSGGSKLAKFFGTDRGSRILRTEAAMTAKYSAAKSLAAKGGDVTIKGNQSLGIPDQKVSGTAIVGRMETTPTVAADYLKPGNPDSVASVPVGTNGAAPGAAITFYKDGSVAPASNSQTFGHEILHTIYSGVGVSNGGWTNGQFNLDHQTPFNDASDDIH